jgi:4-amino-4-deoxy-L-arabinose transferase-like glycosyltransferase
VTARWRVNAGALSRRWPLALILGMQVLACVSTLQNTAFQDEALYLYAGRILIHHWLGGPAPLDHYAFYFSGYPGIYPVIGAFLDMIGGLELARCFSLACMLGVTSVVYSISRSLLGDAAAVFAAAAYASVGSVLFLSRLATFDAVCLLMIALATASALHSASARRAWLAPAIGPLLVVAILAKYAALLFVGPVLALLALRSILAVGWRRMVLRLTLALLSIALCAAIAYRIIDKAAFHAIAGSTTSRVAVLREPRLQLFTHVLYMGGVVYVLAAGGLVLVLLHSPRLCLIALALFVSAWLAPAYHIYKQEAISLDKHIAFAMFFAAPMAGYALAWLSGLVPRERSDSHRGYWVAGIAIVLAIFALGLRQSQNLYDWANTGNLSLALHTQLRDGSGRILAEDIEVSRYDARDVTQQWQWNGLLYFYYVNASHHALLGDPAVAQAVRDRYFAFVELSFNYYPADADFAAQQMAATRNYDLVAVIPFKNAFGRGHFFLFRLSLVPGHGTFTNVLQVKTHRWFKTCLSGVCQP